MAPTEITMARGLPESLRGDAVRVFDEAFGEKLAKALPSGERRRRFIERTLVADRCLVATDGSDLLGLVGLSAAEGRYAGGPLDADSLGFNGMRHILGLWGAIRAALILGFIDHKPEPGELCVDNIAVAGVARGRGVGTMLLDEVATIGREDGFRWLRLDVIDTNPRAQELYERQGYSVIKEQKLYFLNRFAGFGAVRTMELPLGAGTETPQEG